MRRQPDPRDTLSQSIDHKRVFTREPIEGAGVRASVAVLAGCIALSLFAFREPVLIRRIELEEFD